MAFAERVSRSSGSAANLSIFSAKSSWSRSLKVIAPSPADHARALWAGTSDGIPSAMDYVKPLLPNHAARTKHRDNPAFRQLLGFFRERIEINKIMNHRGFLRRQTKIIVGRF